MFEQATLRALMSRHPNQAMAFYPALVASMREFAISSVNREAAFLATIAHESMELSCTTEIWGPTAAQNKYEPPSDVATGLGNTQSGDGFRYRGRGLIMVTGRANYGDVSRALGADYVANPDWLARPADAARVSCWWWSKHGCNELADVPDFEAVTRRVNGGLNGWEQRLDYYKRALTLLAADFSHVTAGVQSTAPSA